MVRHKIVVSLPVLALLSLPVALAAGTAGTALAAPSGVTTSDRQQWHVVVAHGRVHPVGQW